MTKLFTIWQWLSSCRKSTHLHSLMWERLWESMEQTSRILIWKERLAKGRTTWSAFDDSLPYVIYYKLFFWLYQNCNQNRDTESKIYILSIIITSILIILRTQNVLRPFTALNKHYRSRSPSPRSSTFLLRSRNRPLIYWHSCHASRWTSQKNKRNSHKWKHQTKSLQQSHTFNLTKPYFAPDEPTVEQWVWSDGCQT